MITKSKMRTSDFWFGCKRLLLALFLLMVLCPIFSSSLASAQTSENYIYTELDAGSSSLHVVVHGINNMGVAVVDAMFYGYLYCEGTYTEILPPPGWSWGVATGINDKGMVVGKIGNDLTNTEKGILYSEGTYTELLPEGWGFADAWFINKKGVVLGDGRNGDGAPRIFLYSEGNYTLLPFEGWASGINDKGEVIANHIQRGYLYSEGTVMELLYPASNYTLVYGINNKGAVVGIAWPLTIGRRAFLYSEGTYMILHPPDWLESSAYAINDRGMVVGVGTNQSGAVKGFVYNGGIYTEIMPPGWEMIRPTGINEEGIVVGYGLNGDGSGIYKGFIATPSNEK